MLQIDAWKRVMILMTVAVGLLLAMPNAFYTRVEMHNDAQIAMERTGVSTPELEQQAALWPSYLPSSLVNLGLDLRGGAHLLAEVQVNQVLDARMVSFWPEVRDALRATGTIGSIERLGVENGEMRIRLNDNPDRMEEAIGVVRGLSRQTISLTGVPVSDIDVRSEGAILIISVSEAERTASSERTMAQSREIIERRINEVGTREPNIQRQGDDRILIQVPGIGSAQELKDLIGTTAKLTFNHVVSSTSDPNARARIGQIVLPSLDQPGTFYILRESPVVTGEDLVDSQPSFDQNGQAAVSFRFNASGGAKFGQYTAENVGLPFAIVLDGEVISAPRINDAILGGSGIITGNFTVEESVQLAVLLRAGALPAELTWLEERTVGPDLGQDSIDAGRIACIVAFIAVLVFMFLSYGTFGMFANIALIINVGLIFGLLSLIGATLTLPGIAGIVLTIGMAVDANVLIFERIKEELKSAKGPARAIELGYEKALSAILDANVTTFITALILFVMGSGPVRGFAITLGLGIITSVFTAIYVTRLFVVMWFEFRRPKTIEV
ncbi:protein translocase subunit SecD [Parasulfitobacter algicola]|uniref:Protein translocase subunit SecD n=1 Tax=Parasulfitobacter algicola TaxID=2614809 RepID=A0ABX2IQN9_9RHOB|nr:protein translocase subunit SecD [Sulfitobacter algicola]NSX55188.1 protein translocase subunit SecD [Sulfitobacter algicola]